MRRLFVWLAAILPALLLCTLLETLLWWRSWRQRARAGPPPRRNWRTALVFLTGSSDFSATHLESIQLSLLHPLIAACPPDVAVVEPFPFEAETPRRWAAGAWWFWRGRTRPPLWLISLRNGWQTALVTCFPERYGADVAQVVRRRLGDSPTAEGIVFVFGSAGAALALAAAPHLQAAYGCRIGLLGYGGVLGPVAGFAAVTHVLNLIGQRDGWARRGMRLLTAMTPADQRRAAAWRGKLVLMSSGPHEHFGPEDYLSPRRVPGLTTSYRQLTSRRLEPWWRWWFEKRG